MAGIYSWVSGGWLPRLMLDVGRTGHVIAFHALHSLPSPIPGVHVDLASQCYRGIHVRNESAAGRS